MTTFSALDGLANMQRHRDEWREYAYGRREKPKDYLDDNKLDHMPTLIEAQAEQIECLKAKIAELQDEVELWKDRQAASDQALDATIKEYERNRPDDY